MTAVYVVLKHREYPGLRVNKELCTVTQVWTVKKADGKMCCILSDFQEPEDVFSYVDYSTGFLRDFG